MSQHSRPPGWGNPPAPQFQQQQTQFAQPQQPMMQQPPQYPQQQFQQPQQQQFQQPQQPMVHQQPMLQQQPQYPQQQPQYPQQQFQPPQQPARPFGVTGVIPGADSGVSVTGRVRKKRVTTVGAEPTNPTSSVADTTNAGTADTYLPTMLTDPGITAIVATVAPGDAVYIYKGETKMTKDTTHKATDISDRHADASVPDVNLVGDYIYACVKQSVRDKTSGVGYACIDAVYGFELTTGNELVLPDGDNISEYVSAVKAGLVNGSGAALYLDNRLTGYINTFLEGSLPGVIIDSFAEDHLGLCELIQTEYPEIVGLGYDNLTDNILEILKAAVIDLNDDHIETLIVKEVHTVIKLPAKEDAKVLSNSLAGGCVMMTNDSSPVIKTTLNGICEHHKGAFVYVLTDARKYYVCDVPATTSIYLGSVVR